ncbi:MAG: VWA-like domain-containing protein [Candidatus Thorarchaeota archaeon]
MVTIEQLRERVEKARRHVIIELPMAQGSAVKMGIFFSNNFPTAATNGKQIGFNPPFVASISDEELEFVVVHEWGHKMLRHFARAMKIRAAFKGEWTPFHEALLNEAADEEDNYLIEQSRFKILDGSCRDKRFDGMAMEEIFQILLHEREQPLKPDGEPGEEEQSEDGEVGGEQQDEQGGDCHDEGDSEEQQGDQSDEGGDPSEDQKEDGKKDSQESEDAGEDEGEGSTEKGDDSKDESQPDSPGDSKKFGQDGLDDSASLSSEDIDNYKTPDVKDWGKLHDGDDPTQSDIYDEEAESKIEQSNDISVAKLSGKLPENIERILKDINEQSKVDWIAEMAEFVSDACGDDSDLSWRKPHKTYATMDVYAPSLVPEGLGEVAVLIDSSGSMDQKMYELGAGEAVHLINQAAPAVTHVVEFTTEVIATATYEDGIEIDTMPDRQSWGGTDVRVGFDWVQRNAPGTTAIIVMSDMEFFKWPEDTGVPVLWVKIPPSEDNSWFFGKPTFGKMITVR